MIFRSCNWNGGLLADFLRPFAKALVREAILLWVREISFSGTERGRDIFPVSCE